MFSDFNTIYTNMDRGDSRFIIHESFKDLKTRRAEQEAYRKALDEQIMQKKLLQQQEREKHSGRPSCKIPDESKYYTEPRTENKSSRSNAPSEKSSHSTPARTYAPVVHVLPSTIPLTPGRLQSQLQQHYQTSGIPKFINDIDSFNEPHPAAVVANMELFLDPTTFHQNYEQPNTICGPASNFSLQHVEKAHPDTTNFCKNTFPPVWQAPVVGAPPTVSVNQGNVFALTQMPRECNTTPNTMSEDSARRVEEIKVISARSNIVTRTPQIPEITPEAMKYIQQVMPGFTMPITTPDPYNNPSISENKYSVEKTESESISKNLPVPHVIETQNTDPSNNQAFSSGTSSESSSVEDVLQTTKAHVSQTSEQLAGVKVTRRQYKAELQRQIDERRRREEELQQQEQEAEEKIQEKIRIEQEKMQREYEEELRKQKMKELESENKRLAVLAKQKEIIKAEDESRAEKKGQRKKRDTSKNEGIYAEPSSSTETIESIGEFFDATMKSEDNLKFQDPDDRVIPVVAKKLTPKQKLEGFPEENTGEFDYYTENFSCKDEVLDRSLTARVQSAFPSSSESYALPEPPEQDVVREIAIRSAPCPDSNGYEFLSSLKSYLKDEKSKHEKRVRIRASKSAGGF